MQVRFEDQETLIISHLFTIIEYILVSYFFYLILKSKLRSLILPLSVLFLSYAIFNIIKGSDQIFDSVPVAIEAILIMGYIIFYFLEQLRRTSVDLTFFIYSTSTFWIATAFLIYFAGMFFIFIYAQNFNYFENTAFLNQFKLFNNTFLIIRNILLALAFVMKNEKYKSSFTNSYT